MDVEARKADIRRRVALLKYPRRSRAVFTDENDHNPVVLRDCSRCHGTGHTGESWSEQGLAVEADVLCPACDGSGVTGEAEPYFPVDAPPLPARPDDRGWLTCPGCSWRFTVHDSRAWTGRRHKRCGQRIDIAVA